MSAPDAVHDRFDIRLLPRPDEGGEGRELPMRILVLGAFTGQRRPTERVESRKPVMVAAASLAQVMAAMKPQLRLTVDDALSGVGQTTIEVQFASLDDFTPDQVIRAMPAASALLETRSGLAALMAESGAGMSLAAMTRAAQARHPQADPAHLAALFDARERSLVGSPAAQRGLAAAVRAGAATGDATALLDHVGISGLIADIDLRLSAQADAVLHHPEFRALEARWRGLLRLAVRTDSRHGVLVDLLDVAKDELRDDFEDSSDLIRSGLFKVVYAGEYGQHGGQPYALMATDWAFSSSPADLALLTRMAAVAAMAHAPLLAAADPALLGLRSFDHLEDLHDLGALLSGPTYAKWRAFRASEDARYVGLVLPGVLLRTPWGEGVSGAASFAYREGGDGRLWGGGACALASRIAASFARWRWCAEAVGPGAGAIEALPLQGFAACGRLETRLPVESWLSEARAAQFAEEGLIAIASLRGNGESGFLAAPSCRQSATFARDAAGRAAAMSERLGIQLPWLMLACRFAHCLKVMQRERIGSATSREDLERQLEEWILRYVVDMDNADAATRQSCPLRAARLRVEDVPGASGWYRINLSITPHVRHLGTAFSLAVVGRLDRPGVGAR